jgi:hypothetical protein
MLVEARIIDLADGTIHMASIYEIKNEKTLRVRKHQKMIENLPSTTLGLVAMVNTIRRHCDYKDWTLLRTVIL